MMLIALVATWGFMIIVTFLIWRLKGRGIQSIPLSIALFTIPTAVLFEAFVWHVVDTTAGRNLMLFVIVAAYVTSLTAFTQFVLSTVGSTDKAP